MTESENGERVNSAPDRGRRARPLVLHVSEAMGGGLESAIRDFISSSSGYDHALLFSRRGAFGTGDVADLGGVYVEEVPQSPMALAVALRDLVCRLQPDLVHLHSAWAGLVGRVVLLRTRVAVVYSPHSYYFDRTDRPRRVRFVARSVERLLARATTVTAAVSPLERAQAQALGSTAVYVPNIATVKGLPALRAMHRARRGADGPYRVVATGRLAAQKDPAFFSGVKAAFDRLHPDTAVDWVWVGDGEAGLRAELTLRGVEVTGWMSRQEGLEIVAGADLFLHGAAWEGSPISLLEVQLLGVPSVVRSIPAVVALGYPEGIVSHLDAAHAVFTSLTGEDRALKALPEPEEWVVAQGAALDLVYRRALERAGIA